MLIVRIHEGDLKIDAEFPSCECCRDRGHVETPIIDYGGRSYTGHGPCECHICAAWHSEARSHSDMNAGTIPLAVLQAADSGKASKQWELRACPARGCPNGPRFLAWLRRSDEWLTGDRKMRKAFYSVGWRTVDPFTEEGRKLIALWRKRNEEREEAARLKARNEAKRFKQSFRERRIGEGAPRPVLGYGSDEEYMAFRSEVEGREQVRQQVAVLDDAHEPQRAGKGGGG